MQVGYLGPLEVRDRERVLDVPGRRLRVLLGRLAAEVPGAVAAAVLVDAVWPDDPPADPQNSLQSLVSRLRRALGDPAAVQQTSGGYRLAVDPDDVDGARFTRLAARGHRELEAGSPAAAAATLLEALGCWRGQPLPDDDGREALALRLRLAQRRTQVVLDRLTAELDLGRAPAPAVLDELSELRADEPLREDLVLLQLRALVALGRPGDALACYEQARRRLADELGADPSPRLRAAHAELLAAPSGDHRRTNVRATVTSFVGREGDLARLDALLDAGRLVTVVGPGGAGKTRIATELAATWLPRSSDGVWFVELAPVSEPDGIAVAVLDSLGVRDVALLEPRGDRPRQQARDRVLAVLASAHCLLVLDNCEHVVHAAAHLVTDLLGRCPGVRVLATSREPLGVDGEVLHPLPPLGVPAAEPTAAAAGDSPAVRLLLDRARAAGAELVLDECTAADVVEVVRRLDGLPLAIELAAARLRVLSVGEIAARLSDRFRLLTGGRRTAVARHRTLRAVVEWSWELLTPTERVVAERFCVFPAGATADAVAAVTVVEPVELDDVLAALVDKSLLGVDRSAAGPSRFRMLETLREYGAERLAEAGTLPATRDAHAAWYVGQARLDDGRLRGHGQRDALLRFDVERENHLAALTHLCAGADAAGALDLVVHLCWAWSLRENAEEAQPWLRAVLAVPGVAEQPAYPLVAALALAREASFEDGGDTQALVDAARRLSSAALAPDDPAQAVLAMVRPLLLAFGGEREEAATLLADLEAGPDSWVRAAAQTVRLLLAENDGEVDVLRRDADRGVAAWTGLGDAWGLAGTLSARAQLRTLDGDLDGATTDLVEALALVRSLGGQEDTGALLRLADLRLRADDVAGARTYAERLAAGRSSRAPSVLVDLFVDLVAVALALAEGDERVLTAARDRLRAALVVGLELPGMRSHAGALAWTYLAEVAVHQGDLAAAEHAVREAHRFAVLTRDLPMLAAAGVALADLALARGQDREAAAVLAAGARLRGSPDPTDRRTARITRVLRERLGGELDAVLATAGTLDRETAAQGVDPAVVLAQPRRR